MSCEHSRIRCTNNVYYCIECGARLPDPDRVKEAKPAEGQKKTAKRRTKKEAE